MISSPLLSPIDSFTKFTYYSNESITARIQWPDHKTMNDIPNIFKVYRAKTSLISYTDEFHISKEVQNTDLSILNGLLASLRYVISEGCSEIRISTYENLICFSTNNHTLSVSEIVSQFLRYGYCTSAIAYSGTQTSYIYLESFPDPDDPSHLIFIHLYENPLPFSHVGRQQNAIVFFRVPSERNLNGIRCWLQFMILVGNQFSTLNPRIFVTNDEGKKYEDEDSEDIPFQIQEYTSCTSLSYQDLNYKWPGGWNLIVSPYVYLSRAKWPNNSIVLLDAQYWPCFVYCREPKSEHVPLSALGVLISFQDHIQITNPYRLCCLTKDSYSDELMNQAFHVIKNSPFSILSEEDDVSFSVETYVMGQCTSTVTQNTHSKRTREDNDDNSMYVQHSSALHGQREYLAPRSNVSIKYYNDEEFPFTKMCTTYRSCILDHLYSPLDNNPSLLQDIIATKMYQSTWTALGVVFFALSNYFASHDTIKEHCKTLDFKWDMGLNASFDVLIHRSQLRPIPNYFYPPLLDLGGNSSLETMMMLQMWKFVFLEYIKLYAETFKEGSTYIPDDFSYNLSLLKKFRIGIYLPEESEPNVYPDHRIVVYALCDNEIPVFYVSSLFFYEINYGEKPTGEKHGKFYLNDFKTFDIIRDSWISRISNCLMIALECFLRIEPFHQGKVKLSEEICDKISFNCLRKVYEIININTEICTISSLESICVAFGSAITNHTYKRTTGINPRFDETEIPKKKKRRKMITAEPTQIMEI